MSKSISHLSNLSSLTLCGIKIDIDTFALLSKAIKTSYSLREISFHFMGLTLPYLDVLVPALGQNTNLSRIDLS